MREPVLLFGYGGRGGGSCGTMVSVGLLASLLFQAPASVAAAGEAAYEPLQCNQDTVSYTHLTLPTKA